jgi:uncharacterized membrane protein (Fun14 family)
MSDDISGRHNHRFSGAVAELPTWKKRLLAIALVAALLGGGGHLATLLSAEPRPAATTPAGEVVVNDVPPGGASGFVGQHGPSSADAAGTPPVQTDAPARSWTEALSGWVFRVGLSIFAGVVIGTIFRMFIKTMAALAALVVGAIVVLSYFKVLPIDFATMRTNYDSFAGWAQGQIGGLKDAVMNTLPSAMSATVGFFLGFKK